MDGVDCEHAAMIHNRSRRAGGRRRASVPVCPLDVAPQGASRSRECARAVVAAMAGVRRSVARRRAARDRASDSPRRRSCATVAHDATSCACCRTPSVRVTIPRHGSRREAEAFVRTRTRWIAERRQEIEERRRDRRWRAGQLVWWRGMTCRVEIEAGPGAHVSVRCGELCCDQCGVREDYRPVLEPLMRARALDELPRRLRTLARTTRTRRGAGHGSQPAIALGVLLSRRQHRPQLAPAPDARGRVRVRPPPRADAPASAQSLTALLGRGRGRLPRLRQRARVAPSRGPRALLMVSLPPDDPPFVDSTAVLSSLYQAPLAEFIATAHLTGVATQAQRTQGGRRTHRLGGQAVAGGLPRQPGVLARTGHLRRRARRRDVGAGRAAGAVARRHGDRRQRDDPGARRGGAGGRRASGRRRGKRRAGRPARPCRLRCGPRSRRSRRTASRPGWRTATSSKTSPCRASRHLPASCSRPLSPRRTP